MIPKVWLTGQSSEDDIEKFLKGNKSVLRQFLRILDDLEAREYRRDLAQDDYDTSSWAYRQADRNGARRAINEIRKLFPIRDQE